MVEYEQVNKWLARFRQALNSLRSNSLEGMRDEEDADNDKKTEQYWVNLGIKLGIDYAIEFLGLYQSLIHIEFEVP